MYGVMYEELLEENTSLKSELTDVQKQNKALLDRNEDLEKPSFIEEIDIQITNPKELKLDKLLNHQLVDLMKEELDSILGKPIQHISESDDLLIATIENKTYTIHDFTYTFEVKKLIVARRLKIQVKAELEK